ncbi:hypothetical protein C8Q70DRAFT_945833 [Cubamyces menziesii]|nr:hypothetical protein C8Q70DRAFT_945833 [Cubamyces menziesii]
MARSLACTARSLCAACFVEALAHIGYSFRTRQRSSSCPFLFPVLRCAHRSRISASRQASRDCAVVLSRQWHLDRYAISKIPFECDLRQG